MATTKIALLTSGMVTEHASELVVEVTLHLEKHDTGYRLVPGKVHHLQSTPSLVAIQQANWYLSLEPGWVIQNQLIPEGWAAAAVHYQQQTEAIFKRRPWEPDKKPQLHNKLQPLPEGKTIHWQTLRQIRTETQVSDGPPKPLHPEPVVFTGASAPDD